MVPNFSQRQNGNFLVLVSFIATAFVLFFSLFTYIAKSYLIGQENSELSVEAAYAAESVFENLQYEYDAPSNPRTIPNTNNDGKVKLCKNYKFNFAGGITLDQAVIDFGDNCTADTVEIGAGKSGITKSATRMQLEETGYLDRYQLFEYRLTRSEFLEKDASNTDYPKPDHLKITWWNDAKEKNPKVEFILASWANKGTDKMSNNISVQRFIPTDSQAFQDPTTKQNSFDLYDLSDSSDKTALFCDIGTPPCVAKEYILFIKSFSQSLHFTIAGRKTIIGNIIPISIPSRFLTLETQAIIENEQNPLKILTKTFKGQRQFYTDFDSNFPYAKYEIR